jgi:hypothetical protein
MTITVVRRGVEPATLAGRVLLDDAATGMARVGEEIAAIAGGARPGKVTVLVEGSTAAAGTGTLAWTAASCTAGDTVAFVIPGLGVAQVITAVALDATVTASPNSGYYSLQTVTNAAVGTSVKNAINNHPGLRKYFTATDNGSGTVTITAIENALGSMANGVVMIKHVTTAGAVTLTQITGGADIGSAPSETCTLGGAALTANDTLTIGSVVFTWKVSAAAEGEVTIGASDALSLANLTAKINAHSKLQGLMSATDDGATICTITWLGPPRAGELLYFAKSASNASAMVITGSGTFRTTPTEAYYAARKQWALGAP